MSACGDKAARRSAARPRSRKNHPRRGDSNNYWAEGRMR